MSFIPETAAQTELRGLLGESIPSGGTDEDTMVSSALVQAWIDSSSTLTRAAIKGWKFKKAAWANLVNVTDGAASREFGQLIANADLMIEMYTEDAQGPSLGRSRVGKIVRS